MYTFLTTLISVKVSQGHQGHQPTVFAEVKSEAQLLTCHSLHHPDFFLKDLLLLSWTIQLTFFWVGCEDVRAISAAQLWGASLDNVTPDWALSPPLFPLTERWLILRTCLWVVCYVAAAAKSLPSCLTPCNPIDQAPPSPGFSSQEHWSGLPFPSPMQESEKWKWSRSVMPDS